MRIIKDTGFMRCHFWCRNQAELWGNICKIKTFSFFFFQAAGSQTDPEPPNTPQLLPRSLINSWELEESQGAQGGYPAHLLPSASPSSSATDTHPLLSDILPTSDDPSLPSLLFLTHRHLWVLKTDFRELAEMERRSADLHHASSSSSWCRLVRVPLGSVVLHPGERASQVGDRTSNTACPDPKHHHRYRGFESIHVSNLKDWKNWLLLLVVLFFNLLFNHHFVSRRSHTVELLLGGQRLLLLFPLAQDRSSFLVELSQRRASLEGLKMVAMTRVCTPCPHQGHHTQGENQLTDQDGIISADGFV